MLVLRNKMVAKISSFTVVCSVSASLWSLFDQFLHIFHKQECDVNGQWIGERHKFKIKEK